MDHAYMGHYSILTNTASTPQSGHLAMILIHGWPSFSHTTIANANTTCWLCSDPDIAHKIGIANDYADYHCDQSQAGCCYNFISKVVANAAQWAPQGLPADYCLSEKTCGRCGDYNVNVVILVIVVICNVGKVLSMLYIVFCIKDDPLMTVGDAIQSCLASPDKRTAGMCLASKADVIASSVVTATSDPEPKPYQPRPQRWRTVASKRRWTLFIFPFLAAILTVLGLLGLAIGSLPAKPNQTSGHWALAPCARTRSSQAGSCLTSTTPTQSSWLQRSSLTHPKSC